MVKFSIFLPTYNRHDLVVKTLNSLIAQTYADFEILFYDNGSNPSVESIVNKYQDYRIKYTRYEENQDVNDIAEDSLKKMSGSYFLFLADDDALVPGALAIVADIIDKHEIDILQIGFTPFSHVHRTVDIGKVGFKRFTGKLEEYDSKEAAYHFCNGWGIGQKYTFKAPKMAHSSGIFISKQLIDKTRQHQGELFVKPFGDIGYVGALLNATTYYFVDAPLAIIGETQIREMNGAKPGQRQKWEKEVKYLEHSPVKGASFVNMGTDAHLKVLYRNKCNAVYDCRLRPNFYLRHLKQVFSDSPWTWKTVRDVAESIPHYLISIFTFITLKSITHIFDKLFYKICSLKTRTTKEFNENVDQVKEDAQIDKIKEFNDINEYAAWVNDNYVKSLLNNI